MALAGPRSVAMSRLHPCSHWPLFSIVCINNVNIFEIAYLEKIVKIVKKCQALLKESNCNLTASEPTSSVIPTREVQPKNSVTRQDSTDDKAVASYPAYPGSNTDDSLSCCSVPCS